MLTNLKFLAKNIEKHKAFLPRYYTFLAKNITIFKISGHNFKIL